MEKIKIFDTTLRDGEQSPGASMTIEQKCEIADQLANLGVDIIEAGFPISSPHQFEACQLISKKVKGPTIAALARALEKDIDAASEATKKAVNSRIHTFLATSPIHMKYKLNKEPNQVIEMAVKAVKYARNKAGEVEFSPEDATRSDLPFLCQIIEKVIDAGATIINIPDTVGYAIPEEFGAFIKAIKEGVPNMDKAIISVHCHNDLGLGVANTVSAINNGARQAEVTINGIGERAGNAALEELVMSLNVRNDILPFTTNINTKQLYKTSKLISNIICFPIPRNKAIVGDNAFAHESGIHQDGVLKNKSTYEIMTPESVGRESNNIVLGRHSGMHGFKKRLGELNIKVDKEELKKLYDRFVLIADKKKEVYDEDIFVIVGDTIGKQTGLYSLEYFNIISGNVSIPTATVKVKVADEIKEEAATGDGPIDAVFNAIDRTINIKTTLKEFIVQAVTPGKKALGEVTVTIEVNKKPYTGKGSSTDIFEASARAYINALNKYSFINREEK